MKFIEQKNWIGIDEKLFIKHSLERFFERKLSARQRANFWGNNFEKLEENIVISIKSGRYDDDMNELYIRFGTFGYDNYERKQIIIARISFKKSQQKKGNGVSLLFKLYEIAEKFDYEVIRFEVPNRGCRAFCNRLKFLDDCSIDQESLISNLRDYSAKKYSF